ncbi:MAG: hypothetical protein ACFFAO_13365 [Candidatus Hermodarchaeota archaeon]
MIEFPLDEKLVWAESEDVDWSERVREKYDFSMNPLSYVKLMKYKSPKFNPMTMRECKKLKKHIEKIEEKTFQNKKSIKKRNKARIFDKMKIHSYYIPSSYRSHLINEIHETSLHYRIKKKIFNKKYLFNYIRQSIRNFKQFIANPRYTLKNFIIQNSDFKIKTKIDFSFLKQRRDFRYYISLILKKLVTIRLRN